MPKYKYKVEILELKEVHDIPGAWGPEQFRALLGHLEYEGVDEIPEEELKDMACLALSDFDKEEAVEKVLECRIGDKLNSGQRKNLGNEMQEDPLWTEYSDLSLHEELFNVGCMLFWTFPRNFPSPDIARLKLKISALTNESRENLKDPKAPFLCRLLKDGMDQYTIMYRLFDENLDGNLFPEADHILWSYNVTETTEGPASVSVTIYTSWNWVEDLKGLQTFDSTAYADGQLA
jgi:hypothetical protein